MCWRLSTFCHYSESNPDKRFRVLSANHYTIRGEARAAAKGVKKRRPGSFWYESRGKWVFPESPAGLPESKGKQQEARGLDQQQREKAKKDVSKNPAAQKSMLLKNFPLPRNVCYSKNNRCSKSICYSEFPAAQKVILLRKPPAHKTSWT